MDYEEAYKEAIKRAKKLYEQGTITEILNYVFPELAESEDERIRKALLEMVNNFIVDGLWVNSYNVHKEDAIAWLEKQGEQNKQHLYDIIIALWDLLDKIDTFSDLQIDDTNSDNPFRKIEHITQERHKFVKSDGYNLFIENVMITNDKIFEKQGEQNHNDDKNETVSKLIAIAECLEMNGDCSFNGYSGNECGKFLRKLSKTLWLEKQGETYTKKDVDDAWLKGICDAKREIEKQSAISPIHSNSSNIRKDEQKSALTGVEEQEGVAGRDYIPVEWVEAIESYGKWKIVRVNEQKPALSKENSCYYDDICEILINLINSTKSKINKDAIQKDLDWLISVKESQSRPAWSEEDEERLKSCLNILQAKGIMGVTETVNSKWLKSIKDRLKGE